MYAYNFQNQAIPESVEPLLFTDCPGMDLMLRGGNKDVYDLGDMLLLVSTDRLSASGQSLSQGATGKGKIVNQLSAYWFRKLRNIIPNHFVSADSRCYPEPVVNSAEILDGRSMLVWETTPLPVRCVVRGYLAGDGWREYQEKGEICGVKLPAGLVESQRLPSPIFTPATKTQPGEMDENIDFNLLQSLFGKTLAEQLRETSLRLYFTAWQSARERGILIADTTFEFGLHDGKLMLIDECLTPDTSRFWERDKYRHGGHMPSLDKQMLVDYLDSLDKSDSIPHLPEEMLLRIEQKYREAYRRIIGTCSNALNV